MVQLMYREGDFWDFESFDSFHDYRDYIFIAETNTGKLFLPEAVKQSITESDVRSNGHDGWNFYTKARDFKNSEPVTNKIGPESYGFTAEGVFWCSNVIIESIFGVTQVEVAFWSYSQNRWIVEAMILDGNFYTFNSYDSYTDSRDYLFYLTTPDGKIPVPAHIINRLVNITDLIANGTGGYNFHTMPKDKPIDTKSAMILLSTTISDYKSSVLKIYPNPVSDKINLEHEIADQLKWYEIYNMMGSLILKDDLYEESIAVHGLNPGIYLLRLVGSRGNVYATKFIKSK
jgi:hypothetical protein